MIHKYNFLVPFICYKGGTDIFISIAGKADKTTRFRLELQGSCGPPCSTCPGRFLFLEDRAFGRHVGRRFSAITRSVRARRPSQTDALIFWYPRARKTRVPSEVLDRPSSRSFPAKGIRRSRVRDDTRSTDKGRLSIADSPVFCHVYTTVRGMRS